MNISVKVQGLDSVYALTDAKVLKAAAYRAINRTVDGGVTDISREVRAQFNIRKGDLDKRIRKQKCPDYDTLRGSVTVADEPKSALPLIQFGAVERRNLAQGSVKTAKGRNGFVSQRLKRKASVEGVGYKVLKDGGQGFSRNAFIIPGGGGSLQVVRRLPGQKGRYALKEKRVITPASMVGSLRHGVLDRIKASLQQRLDANMAREAEYYLAKLRSGQPVGGTRRR